MHLRKKKNMRKKKKMRREEVIGSVEHREEREKKGANGKLIK